MTFTRRVVGAALGAVLAAGASLGASEGNATEKLKMVLNWRYQGPQGWFFIAQDKGYFAAEGIDLTIDQGNGSGAAVPAVANGSYDIGFGDINALIEFAAKQPDAAPLAVYMMYNRPPFTIAVKSSSGIATPKDLEGRTIGGAPNDGALKLFPAFCKVAKIDCGAVKISNIQPNLREPMLMQGQFDGAFGYVNTIRFSAKLIGADAEKDLRYISYGDYGMDLYSNAIIVSRKLAKDRPDLVKGFNRALNKGVVDALKDPDAAIAAVAKREPLTKTAIERERFDATLKDEMNHPELAMLGLGDVDDARLKKSIDILVDANKLPRTPEPAEVFSRAYLPPKADRPTKLF